MATMTISFVASVNGYLNNKRGSYPTFTMSVMGVSGAPPANATSFSITNISSSWYGTQWASKPYAWKVYINGNTGKHLCTCGSYLKTPVNSSSGVSLGGANPGTSLGTGATLANLSGSINSLGLVVEPNSYTGNKIQFKTTYSYCTITINYNYSTNTAPYAPSITSPRGDWVASYNPTPLIKVSAIDPNGDVVAINVYIYNYNNGSLVQIGYYNTGWLTSGQVHSGNNVVCSTDPNAQYVVRAQAYDPSSALSPWSTRYFYRGTAPQVAPGTLITQPQLSWGRNVVANQYDYSYGAASQLNWGGDLSYPNAAAINEMATLINNSMKGAAPKTSAGSVITAAHYNAVMNALTTR